VNISPGKTGLWSLTKGGQFAGGSVDM